VSAGPCQAPAEFVAQVKPLLEAGDLQGLLAMLRERWSAEKITGLLAHPDNDVKKVAALALSLVGGKCCIACLAQELRNPDPMTNQMAEHALWSIWFRCSTTDATQHLCRGAKAMERRDFAAAIADFTQAVRIDPTFAEGYNQRAIARYLNEQYEESIADCHCAVKHMPCHFGAWAGMGHCYANLGRIAEALRCYQHAMEINPHLREITQTVQALRSALTADPEQLTTDN
jgi:tetratricopeptide (TPR) repeat protein